LESDFGGRRRQGEDDVKYGTGSSSACRSANHATRADP
jgi:hypothetical protein